jgi:hypothetical protein
MALIIELLKQAQTHVVERKRGTGTASTAEEGKST